jgi:putative tryptophan/tyrosine transport system substrate-binding protein
MKRREFIAALGGAALWPLAARAQQPLRRIGFLLTLTKDNPEGRTRFAAFRQGLEAAGWNEGRNIRIEDRWPADDHEQLQSDAAELVDMKPDAILAGGSRPMLVLQARTRTIPVVFVAAAGTVEHGIVTSVARPAGNMTGFTTVDDFAIAGKQLGLIKELIPRLKRVLLIMHRDHPSLGGYQRQLDRDAASVGVDITIARTGDAAEMQRAIEKFAGEPDAAR